MNPGDIMETAMWADGTETADQLADFETDIKAELARMANEEGVIIGPLMMTVKRPGEERVPPVPDHIKGADVRLIVGEAKVVCFAPDFSINPWHLADELDGGEFKRAASLIRADYAKVFPKRPPLTDGQCRTVISNYTPEEFEAALQRGQFNVLDVLD